MTQQKNPTSFYGRGNSDPRFAYYAEGYYPIVKPFSEFYYGFLTNINTTTNSTNTTNTTNSRANVKSITKDLSKLRFKN